MVDKALTDSFFELQDTAPPSIVKTDPDTEAEYIAATHAVKEVMWIQMFLAEVTWLAQPTTLNCKNQLAILVSKIDQYHGCTKHIDIRYHFIQDIAEHMILSICYCLTLDMLTKAFPSP